MSNRDSERNEDRADPIEIILYAVFVATSARASVAELADILQVPAASSLCLVTLTCLQWWIFSCRKLRSLALFPFVSFCLR